MKKKRLLPIDTIRAAFARRLVMAGVVIGLTALALTFWGSASEAQPGDQSQAHWRATLQQLLGIQPDPKPLRGTSDRMYNAVVVDEQRFAAIGIGGAHNGDRLRLTQLGEGFWRIKHLATGIDFEIDLNPTEATGSGNRDKEKP